MRLKTTALRILDSILPSMTTAKMHPGEPDIDSALVRDLIKQQFPNWARLQITSVASSGTDNIVKVFWEPDELVARVRMLGWDIRVNSAGPFFWLKAVPA